jgi:hypothetical protein
LLKRGLWGFGGKASAGARLGLQREAAHGALGRCRQRVPQRRFSGRADIHQQDCLIFATYRQQAPVLAERQRAHGQRAPRRQAAQLSGRVGEQAHGAVLAAAGEHSAARGRSHRGDLAVVHADAALLARRFQRLRLAQQQQAVRAAAHKVLSGCAGLFRGRSTDVRNPGVAGQVCQLPLVICQKVAYRHGLPDRQRF